MAKIYDWTGSAATEIKKIYDWNGSVATQLKKGFDWNGTTASLIYQAIPDALILFENGTWKNQDLYPIRTYNIFYAESDGGIATDGQGSGIWTNTAVPTGYNALHIDCGCDIGLAGSSLIQYGTNNLSGTLPTIATTGANRLTYEDVYITGDINSPHTLTIPVSAITGAFVASWPNARRLRIWKIWLTP